MFFLAKNSGDQDSVIPLTGSRFLVSRLAKRLGLRTSVPYRVWFARQQVNKQHSLMVKKERRKHKLIHWVWCFRSAGGLRSMEMCCLLRQCEELRTRSHSHSLRDLLCCSRRSWTVILYLKNSDIYHDLLSLYVSRK